MEFNPKVSIVIPVYNGVNYLREAIDSALAQTYQNVEVIVVNDGSADGGKTEEIALSYGDRIRYLRKENGGVASALNVGIREMTGEYFSWLSHDDVYYPEKIERQVEFLDLLQDRDAVVLCKSEHIDENSRFIGLGSMDEELLKNPMLLVVATYVGGCSLLVPAKCFHEVGLFNEELLNVQDNEMWLRIAKAGFDFHYVPEILIKIRIHSNQGTRTTSERHVRETKQFFLWALDFIGTDTRLQYSKELFNILFSRKQILATYRLFCLLRGNGRTIKALSEMTIAVLSIIKGKVNELLRPVINKILFRNASHYWENRYRKGGNSGVGSYGKYAEYKADFINTFIKEYQITRVVELGCGDGNQLRYLNVKNYLGLDVAKTAIELCRRKFGNDRSKKFVLYDKKGRETAKNYNPELALSLDVIYHLVDDTTFYDYIADMFNLSNRYVIIYSADFDQSYDSCHQRNRNFSLYVKKHISSWKLLKIEINPYKGKDTLSDFFIYEKIST